MPTARARFSPRVLAADTLERLFVAREHLLEDIADSIDRATESDERGHLLFVGPRGAGKTHLISLAYHRADAARLQGDRFRMAWLDEDPWAIVSYASLLAAILVDLGVHSDRAADEASLESHLRAAANDGGPVVVFAENLDLILSAIGRLGQQRLRSLMQSSGCLLLIATSTRLTHDLLDEARPFYSFFITIELQPFTTKQAAQMLQAIALADGNYALAEELESKEAYARLRAAETLAGGQPRVWALLANALTLHRLDELLEVLFTQLDDLTPYYQEQLGRLSSTQRQLVVALVNLDRAANVKEISSNALVDERQAAKALKELVAKGWASEPSTALTSRVDRRQRFYELSEPLLRLSFELKASRGAPISLLVDFLIAWFDPADLTDLDDDDELSMIGEYIDAAGNAFGKDTAGAAYRVLTGRTRISARSDEHLLATDRALAELQRTGDPGAALALPTPIRRVIEQRLLSVGLDRVRLDIHRAALTTEARQHASTWLRQAESLTSSGGAKATAALWHVFDRNAEVAMQLVEPYDLLPFRKALVNALLSSGQTASAVSLAADTVRDGELVYGADDDFSLGSRYRLVRALVADGQPTAAVAECTRLIADNKRVHGFNSTHVLASRNRLIDALVADGQMAKAVEAGRRLLADNERINGPDNGHTRGSRNRLAQALIADGQTASAVELCMRLVAENERIHGPYAWHTRSSHLRLVDALVADSQTTAAVDLCKRLVAEDEQLYGVDAVRLGSRRRLVDALIADGRTEQAVVECSRLVVDNERIHGPDASFTLTARRQLAEALVADGSTAEAISELTRLMASEERVHPESSEFAEDSRHRLAELRKECAAAEAPRG
ncbi:MAG: ATP-binding protein [Pseudomonadota bacterium]